MADNFVTDPGAAGVTFASDDIGPGVHYPITKLTYGALDSQTIAASGAGAVTAGVPRFTLASDDPGVAHLATIAGDTTSIDGKITACNTGAVTISAALPAGDNNIGNVDIASSVALDVSAATVTVDNGGTFAVQVDGDALTALQIIDNPVFVDDAPFTLTTSSVSVGGAIRDDSLSALGAAEGDAVPLRVGATGALHVTGGGGGTEYNEGDASPNPIVGTASLMERDDALSTLTPTEGQWASFRCDSQGALWVNAVNADGTNTVDAVAGAADTGAVMLAVRDDLLSTITPADGDYARLRVTSDGALYIHDRNFISTNNSTVSTLANDATYTGTGEDISQYSSVSVQLDSSHNSATDGMTFEFSPDNSNWDEVHLFTYTAADGARHFQFPVHAQYFRVVYTNGGTTQTHFRVQTILKAQNSLTSVHRLVDSVDPDRSAQLVKAAIVAQAAGTGDFVPVQTTAAGNLKTAIEEVNGSIAGGGVEATALRVTMANDSTGLLSVDNDGTFVVQEDGAALTALELIDNPIVAHDAAISGSTGVNVIGARAVASVEGQTETAAADASQVNATLSGNIITQSQVAPEELVSFYIANTDGAEDSVTGLDAGGATIHNYITSVTISNRHATTDGQVMLLDGSAGSVFWEFPAPATGGTTHNFDPPLKQPTVNTALYVDPSAAITTLGISIAGYQGQG